MPEEWKKTSQERRTGKENGALQEKKEPLLIGDACQGYSH